jgi:hypothetical protein
MKTKQLKQTESKTTLRTIVGEMYKITSVKRQMNLDVGVHALVLILICKIRFGID